MVVCLKLDTGERVPFSPDGWTIDSTLERSK
jgi:hypothetical protein